MQLQNKLDYINNSTIDNTVKEDLTESLNHGILVSNLAVLLAKGLGMNHEFCDNIAQAGMLHDIGKLKLGKYLYGRKKDALAIEEMKYVRMHPTLGYDILKEYDYQDEVLEAIYHHHENYDGSGYPNNLKGDSIPYGARILRTCDVFAALISDRPYRSAFDIETAIELMIDEVKNFDMHIFLTFLEVIHSAEFSPIQEFINSINNDEGSKKDINIRSKYKHNNNPTFCEV